MQQIARPRKANSAYQKTSSVHGGRFLPQENKAVWSAEYDRLACQVTEDTIIMSRMNTPALVGESGYVFNNHPKLFLPDRLWRIFFNNRVSVRFVSFLLASENIKREIESLSTGTSPSMKNLTVESMSNLPIPIPPLVEQLQIVNYLDHETAHIDALITEKERMLALLEEKRAALISQAVTRGLDPDVPLKPSGLDWLGDIPVHWAVERLKFHLDKLEQGWSPQCDSYPAEGDEWGVLKVGAVNSWDFRPRENKRLPGELRPLLEYRIRPRDVLMSRANTTQLLGSVVLVPEVQTNLLLCDKLYRLSISEVRLSREFAVVFLRSKPGRFMFEQEATGASNSMQNIGQDSVRNVWLPLPPLSEQYSIVTHITAEQERTAELEKSLLKSIALLQERRSALITAAVTGQFDPKEIAA